MTTKVSIGVARRVSAELKDVIQSLADDSQRTSPPTLKDVRLAVQENFSLWTQEGELLHPQDRTSLLIEIDDLIEQHGKDAAAVEFVSAAAHQGE